MGKLASLTLLGALIGAGYYLAQQYAVNQMFERKTIQRIQKQGDKLLNAMDEVPGCKGVYKFQSANFNQDGFFGKTGHARAFYFSQNNEVLDLAYTAEIIDEGRKIIIAPNNLIELQARVTGLMLSGCRG